MRLDRGLAEVQAFRQLGVAEAACDQRQHLPLAIGQRGEGQLRGRIGWAGKALVITSAGIVLAATFSVLTAMPLVFLVEIGVLVGLGVLLDTFVVRSILVPALVLDLGPGTWWPARSARPCGGTGRGTLVPSTRRAGGVRTPPAEAACFAPADLPV